MLHILFLILKIIGIIILSILGIAVTLVCVVLFVPVRYRLKAETAEGLKELRMIAKVTWLFHLISAFAVYENKELDWQVRIAWKKLNVPNKENEKEPVVQEEITHEEPVHEEPVHEEPVHEEPVHKEPIQKESVHRKVVETEEKQSKLEKIKCTIKEICDKLKKVKDFLTDETNFQALYCLKNELFLFLKRIRPDKIKGFVRFGLEDPYNTGRVLAVLSVLYPFYGENIQIYPDFEKEIIEGDVFIKGRIHLIHLLIAICKIYFDNNVKMAYKNFKMLKD